MNGEFINLLSICLHIIIFNTAGLSASVLIVCTLLPSKRSIKILIFFFIARTLVIYIGIRVFIKHYYEAADWYPFLDKSAVTIFSALMLLMFYYVFDTDFFKLYLATSLAEIIVSLPLELTFLSAGFILNTDRYRQIFSEFTYWDFPVVIAYLLLFTCLYKFLKPFLKKYRLWEMKHKRFWAVIIFVYILIAFSIPLSGMANYFYESYIMALISFVVISITVLYIHRSNHLLRTEFNYLNTQLYLIECYLPQLRSQIEQMESSHTVIDAQMREITGSAANQINNSRIKAYLAEIQQAYKHIKAGIYCDNWLVDSVLCYENNIMEQEKISFSCSVQLSSSLFSQMYTKRFTQILLVVLNWSIDENRQISDIKHRFIRLQISQLQNQQILLLETPSGKKHRLKNKSMRRCLVQYQGKIMQEYHSQYTRTIITLQNEDTNTV